MSKTMLRKTLVGLTIIAILAPLAYLGGYFFMTVCLFFGVIAAHEINSLFHQGVNKIEMIVDAIAIGILYFISRKYTVVWIIAVLVILFLMQLIFDESAEFTAYTFLMTVIVGFGEHGVSVIYSFGNREGFVTLLFICFACYVCDAGAYFFGSFFGKHKMAPHVSPNKTWEGAIGGYLLAVIIAIIFYHVIKVPFDNSMLLVAAILLPFVAEIGDLSFSSIKRKFEIKDFGTLIPEHGGVLDRIDSVLFCLMVFQALMIVWGV